MELVILPLARKKMEQRGIPPSLVEETIQAPEQTVPGYGGRTVYQRRYQLPGRPAQLLRVVCEPARTPVVVTAYLTSAIRRYWKE